MSLPVNLLVPVVPIRDYRSCWSRTRTTGPSFVSRPGTPELWKGSGVPTAPLPLPRFVSPSDWFCVYL